MLGYCVVEQANGYCPLPLTASVVQGSFEALTFKRQLPLPQEIFEKHVRQSDAVIAPDVLRNIAKKEGGECLVQARKKGSTKTFR